MKVEVMKCEIFLIISILSSIAGEEISSNEIKCEKYEEIKVETSKDELKSCKFNQNILINATNMELSDEIDEDVKAFVFDGNKKISFLPIVIENETKYSELNYYSACSCSIQFISENNFRKFRNLTYIALSDNKIETISNFVFKGLVKLEYVLLDRNAIKYVGPYLTEVWWFPNLKLLNMNSNKCVNFNATTEKELDEARTELSQKCIPKLDEICIKSEEGEKILYCDDIEVNCTCSLNEHNKICSLGYGIYNQSDDYIVLEFNFNRKIFFLPENIGKNFPKLEEYRAFYGSIKTLTQSNFKDMKNLKQLLLNGNKIERIDSNLFDELSSLETLGLDENKIKFIDSKAFEVITKKSILISLLGNECISNVVSITEYDVPNIEIIRNDYKELIDDECGVPLDICSSTDSTKLNNEIDTSCKQIREGQTFTNKKVDLCVMRKTAAICTINVTFTGNPNVNNALIFEDNKRIQFLPENISSWFPNLTDYIARNCSVKAISKINFLNLTELRSLNLDFNEIERLDGDIFEGLSSLKAFSIQNNKIKSVGQNFVRRLPTMSFSNFIGNVCIDDNFTRENITSKAIKEIQDKCETISTKTISGLT
ncbi:CLUMA_CG006788, isoform A [Clunio marinus]|uniref:CLUMA_CG006788, isoform A n=1 Tax=Clunio marinus TaxID=568069 RepID=A0A1J1HYZ0_9DIPT|nr:CLUMA_CG006788, isoform A [Clunio marinus]